MMKSKVFKAATNYLDFEESKISIEFSGFSEGADYLANLLDFSEGLIGLAESSDKCTIKHVSLEELNNAKHIFEKTALIEEIPSKTRIELFLDCCSNLIDKSKIEGIFVAMM